MSASINTSEFHGGVLKIDITGAASTDNAGLGSILNPFGVDVLILRATFKFTTPSTGAANLGVGITTASAKGTDILNDLDVNGVAAGSFYNGFAMQNTAKTAISAPALWEDDKYITFTGSATTAGLVGELFLEILRP